MLEIAGGIILAVIVISLGLELVAGILVAFFDEG